MFSFFSKKAPQYDFMKLKSNLKMSVTRIRMQQDKRRNNVRRQRRELAELINAKKLDSARVKVEGLIREHKSIDGLDILALFIELVVSRVSVIDELPTCPPDLKEAITSILWAVPRCDELTEFHTIRLQFALKYGKAFCEMSAVNGELSVNARLMEKLGGEIPPSAECIEYLQGIADEFNLTFDAEQLSSPTALINEAPGVTIATVGVSGGVPVIPPIVVPRDELEARLLVLSRA
jgi:vacuolar protein sorting-associated protein IST1